MTQVVEWLVRYLYPPCLNLNLVCMKGILFFTIPHRKKLTVRKLARVEYYLVEEDTNLIIAEFLTTQFLVLSAFGFTSILSTITDTLAAYKLLSGAVKFIKNNILDKQISARDLKLLLML